MKFNFNLKERLENYRRVLMVARKPSRDEFKKIAKICVIGILLVGAIGFATYAFSIIFIG